jgi:hypothetical protein
VSLSYLKLGRFAAGGCDHRREERTMTSHDSDLDAGQFDSDASPSRLAVFPSFTVPQAFAQLAGIALLAAGLLQMAAGAVEALTERGTPIFAGGQRPPFQVPHLSFNLADRLSIFARAGANLTVALLVLVAIVAVMSYRRAGEAAAGLSRVLMLVSLILASVVILANLAVGIELVRNAAGVFTGVGSNRAFGLLQCSAPIGLSIGVLCCAGTRA